jgi:putative ABC transport system ATP-binding protein
MSANIVEINGIFKNFSLGTQEVEIIKDVSFSVKDGDFMILFGPSGCGKSTVLNILLGLEPPTKGSVNFEGKPLYDFSEDERAQLRKQKVGMVYQQSNWVKSLNVLENVSFPLTLRGVPLAEREKKGLEMLRLVDMEQGARQAPTELSSGQQQRVSLARALISDPVLIVADEPTGNLDSKASREIMTLFKEFNRKGKTVVMVTHDLEYLSYASHSVNMSDGTVIGRYAAHDPRLRKLSVSKRGRFSSSKSDKTAPVNTKENTKLSVAA